LTISFLTRHFDSCAQDQVNISGSSQEFVGESGAITWSHDGIRSFLQFRGSPAYHRRDLFCNLSASRQRRGSAFSRKRELPFPPLISCEKDGGLRLGRGLRVSLSRTPRRGPPVTSEKTSSLLKNCPVNPKGIFYPNVQMNVN